MAAKKAEKLVLSTADKRVLKMADTKVVQMVVWRVQLRAVSTAGAMVPG